MLNCEQSDILMLKHMEKNITSEDAAKLAQHVQECENCREQYLVFDELMESMDDIAVSGIELNKVPDYFTSNIMAQVRGMPPYVAPEIVTARKVGRTALFAFWGISAILAAVALILLYNPQYLASLSQTYPIFEGAVAAMGRMAAAFGQVPDWLMSDTTVIGHSFGVAALAFVLVLGMLLVVLHKDEGNVKTSSTV